MGREERAVGKGPCSGAAFVESCHFCKGLGRSEWISIAPQPHPSHPPTFFFFLISEGAFGQTQRKGGGQGTQGCSPVVKLLEAQEEEHSNGV